ncbi:unnamed protein product [Haemonchus placei]|uniref:XK-related protein n=1 Tax=Haemonchus placei TaxID=6290 RepID=A0A0N4X6A0_HAEPC|nr:unnamed protein product [Haemonchus placei]
MASNFKFLAIVLGYRIRLFNVFIKTLSCVLYCVRVVHDSRLLPAEHHYKEGEIKYDYLFWVGRNTYLWLIQTFVALVSLSETIIVFYISYEWNICRLFVNAHFLLELVTSFPFIITVSHILPIMLILTLILLLLLRY